MTKTRQVVVMTRKMVFIAHFAHFHQNVYSEQRVQSYIHMNSQTRHESIKNRFCRKEDPGTDELVFPILSVYQSIFSHKVRQKRQFKTYVCIFTWKKHVVWFYLLKTLFKNPFICKKCKIWMNKYTYLCGMMMDNVLCYTA